MDFALGYEFIGERVTIKITMKNRQGSHFRPFEPSLYSAWPPEISTFCSCPEDGGEDKIVGWMVGSPGYRHRKGPPQSSLESQVWLI